MDYRDLINDTLLIAYEKFHTLSKRESFLSFLIGITIRITGNQIQKKRPERFSSGEDLFALQDSTSGPQENADIHFLYLALSQLGEEQRECIILFEIVGFSIKEIVQIQGASESAVKQRLKRGREKLIELLTFESTQKGGEVHHG
jgi:RNA polymerase sigma-70 factor (ECF subfamily)